MSRLVALDFVKAINNHDVAKIISLMSDDHVFIDAYGNSESKADMAQGWADYFSWFPDYVIEINDVLESADTVVILGYASGTYRDESTSMAKKWRIPAAWRVIVKSGSVKVWQVYAVPRYPSTS